MTKPEEIADMAVFLIRKEPATSPDSTYSWTRVIPIWIEH